MRKREAKRRKEKRREIHEPPILLIHNFKTSTSIHSLSSLEHPSKVSRKNNLCSSLVLLSPVFFLVPKHRNNHDLGISRLGKRFLIKLKTIGEWSRFCLWEEIKTKAHRSSGSDSILCDGIPYILHSFIYSSSSSLLGFFLKRYISIFFCFFFCRCAFRYLIIPHVR